jgi:hypothetical protein
MADDRGAGLGRQRRVLGGVAGQRDMVGNHVMPARREEVQKKLAARGIEFPYHLVAVTMEGSLPRSRRHAE